MAPSRLTEAPRPDQVEYRPIADCPGYFVGSDGSVWSEWRKERGTGRGGSVRRRVKEWRPVQRSSCRGYLRVWLQSVTGPITRQVHHLVLREFVGPCPPGMQCRHLDGNPSNCCRENLAWGTPAENAADRAAHGHTQHGERHYSARLTVGAVLQVRQLHASGGWTYRGLARRFGVSDVAVRNAILGRTWRHVV